MTVLEKSALGLVVSNINFALQLYARAHKTGRPGVEIRHQAADAGPNSRLPDIYFTCNYASLVAQGIVTGLPDLTVAIKSSSDTIVAMRETATYYLANGSRLVWLVYPNYRLVEVYRTDQDVEMLDKRQLLIGHDVLPGFELPVADVFDDPFVN